MSKKRENPKIREVAAIVLNPETYEALKAECTVKQITVAEHGEALGGIKIHTNPIVPADMQVMLDAKGNVIQVQRLENK